MLLRSAGVLSLVTLTAAALLACQSAGKGEEEATCQLPKPGEITSVNQYCPVVLADTVDPAITVDWKGQKVGFCCAECPPKWAKMTPAQKDSALAAAVAKGKIKN